MGRLHALLGCAERMFDVLLYAALATDSRGVPWDNGSMRDVINVDGT